MRAPLSRHSRYKTDLFHDSNKLAEFTDFEKGCFFVDTVTLVQMDKEVRGLQFTLSYIHVYIYTQEAEK